MSKLIQITDKCHYWMGPAPQRKPVIRHGRQTLSARRVLMAEHLGRKLTSSEVVIDTCGESLCVNPEHLQIISRSKLACDSLGVRK